MDRFKQIVTYPQRETAEIIQQCNMEEGIQPGPHLCILKHFGYVWDVCSGSNPPYTAPPYLCDCPLPVIVPQPTPFRRRFTMRKAKWDDFSTDFDESIEEIEPIPENYYIFICLVRVVSRRHIPRWCRTNYIPGLPEESQSLYEAYKKQYSSNPFAEGTMETGNKFIDTVKEEEIWRGHHID